jgi:rubredoxin
LKPYVDCPKCGESNHRGDSAAGSWLVCRHCRYGFDQHKPQPYDDRSFSISLTAQIISDRAKTMTPGEFRESLVKAGIIDERGELTKPYRRK